MEVECAAPGGTQMVIELEGGLRLLVAAGGAVELAARNDFGPANIGQLAPRLQGP